MGVGVGWRAGLELSIFTEGLHRLWIRSVAFAPVMPSLTVWTKAQPECTDRKKFRRKPGHDDRFTGQRSTVSRLVGRCYPFERILYVERLHALQCSEATAGWGQKRSMVD